MIFGLPAKTRRAILAGEHPALVFDGTEPCPVRKGEG
jgi:hypothetical protein